ncbi:MAG TPA: hypothetical protein ENN76_03095 [Euryarchaeota archaeon]|nr:hypothetical protein [Euryarchaeota archaeon]
MGKGLAITSLVTGILSFFLFFLGPLLATVAIITGALGRYKNQGILATVGLILGLTFWVLFALGTVLGVIGRIMAIFTGLF